MIIIAALTLATAAASGALSHADVSVPDPAVETTVTETFTLDGSDIFNWSPDHMVQLQCPDTHPLRRAHEYHPNSGWRIPFGLQISAGGDHVDAAILGYTTLNFTDLSKPGVDGVVGSVANWSAFSRTVTVTLHCTVRDLDATLG
ncbi:hypothetical protein [Microbacterium rhizomatis]|uniref:Uncharacterized protein n=1 Tax=Microbacterium rhizomatis TaxID=1631477 RepID=A0A5J5J3W1_9MICO|nr:hypothetical protein [Microbacterium rhizomatis]KAA9110139.1 hypothetical protein F6B43_00040 [Microbacterium rhizomatis]